MKTLSAPSPLNRQRHVLLALISLGFLTCFRSKSAFNVEPTWDDLCYVEWLYEFLRLAPEMCPAYRFHGHNYFFPGAALVWWPLGFLAKGLATLTQTNVNAWVEASIGISAYLSWALSLVLLHKTLVMKWKPSSNSALWAFGFLLTVPVLHYATVRTTMSHTSEILIASTSLYFLVRQKWLLSLTFMAWLCLTRINDGPYILMVLGAFVDHIKSASQKRDPKRRWIEVGCIFLILLSGLAVLKMALYDGYAQTGGFLIRAVWEAFTLKSFINALFGPFGLSWTGFFWILSFFFGLAYFRKLSWMCRGGLVWMGIHIFLAIGWGSHGGNAFGYRYLIGTYIAAFAIWLELNQFKTRKILNASLILQAIVLSLFTWTYHTRYYFKFNEIQNWPEKFVASLKLMAISPPGTLLLSLWQHLGQLPDELKQYALEGPKLWILAFCTASAFFTLLYSFYGYRQKSQETSNNSVRFLTPSKAPS